MSLRVWGLLGCLQGRRLPTRPRSRPGWLRVPNQSRPRPEKTAGSQISWAALTEASRESGDPPAALTLASVIVLAFGSRRPGWVPRSRRLVASLGALLVFVGGPPIPALAPTFQNTDTPPRAILLTLPPGPRAAGVWAAEASCQAPNISHQRPRSKALLGKGVTE